MDIGPVKGRQSKSLPAKSKRKKLCQINETTTFGAMCLVYWYLLASLWYKFKLERGKLFLFFIQSLVFLCWRLSLFGSSNLFFLSCSSVFAPLFLLMLFDIVHYNGLSYFNICCWYTWRKLGHLQKTHTLILRLCKIYIDGVERKMADNYLKCRRSWRERWGFFSGHVMIN